MFHGLAIARKLCQQQSFLSDFFHGFGDDLAKVIEMDRFFDIIKDAHPDGLPGIVEIIVGADQDDLGGRIDREDGLGQFQTSHAGHTDIRNNEVWLQLAEQIEKLRGIGKRADQGTAQFWPVNIIFYGVDGHGIVIDDQDSLGLVFVHVDHSISFRI